MAKKSKSGSKLPKYNPPVFDTQPVITQTQLSNALGDTYRSQANGSNLSTQVQLSQTSQQLLDTARQGLQQDTAELAAPAQQRQQAFQQLADRSYASMAGVLNQTQDQKRADIESRLNQRLGGSLTSTFASDLLSRLENNRLGQLQSARLEADKYGQELGLQHETATRNRIATFQNVVGDYTDPGQKFYEQSSDFLSGERKRADTANQMQAQLTLQANNQKMQRAQLLHEWSSQRKEKARQRRQTMLSGGSDAALGLLTNNPAMISSGVSTLSGF